MTRVMQVTQAVSALRKARATPSSLSEAAALTFLVYEDNSGAYRWTIVADRGETLAHSASFGSYDEAKQAARIVRDGASSAPLEGSSSNTPPVDVIARRDAATARDRLDAERWLDEGGSFNSETLSQ